MTISDFWHNSSLRSKNSKEMGEPGKGGNPTPPNLLGANY